MPQLGSSLATTFSTKGLSDRQGQTRLTSVCAHWRPRCLRYHRLEENHQTILWQAEARASRTSASRAEVASISEDERREIREGLIAAVVGAGVDDVAIHRLVQRMSANPDALEFVIRLSLSDPARLNALDRTGLMEAGPQAALDGVASLTAEALAMPFAAVSLLDGTTQLLAGCNLAAGACKRWRPVGESVCKFTVASGIPFIVDDATVHPLLAEHPAVASGALGAYAGVPLFSDEDQAVGTLHSWDTRPRRWTSGQVIVLQDMADLAGAKIFRRPI